MAKAEASRGIGSVPHVSEGDPDEDGFISPSGEAAREAITLDNGITLGESEEPQAGVTVGVEQPLPKQRRCSICGELGHTARTCQAEGTAGVATRASRKPSKEAVGAVAPMLVGTLNFCVVTSFGKDCGLTDLEGKLLIPSVQRMMERLPAATAQKAAIIIDPLVIITVVVMWGKRIYSIKQAEAHAKYAVEPFERMRASGASGTTYDVTNGTVADSPPVANEETNRVNIVVDEGTTNGNYGVPNSIRSAFSDNI